MLGSFARNKLALLKMLMTTFQMLVTNSQIHLELDEFDDAKFS